MMAGGTDGDLTCFTCGFLKYRLAPISVAEVSARRPSHGGHRLH